MAKAPGLPRQSHAAAALGFGTRRALLLLAAPAFFVAWASPLFVLTSISRFWSFFWTFSARRIASSLFLVSVLACDVASFSASEISWVLKWTPSVSRFPPMDRAVFLH